MGDTGAKTRTRLTPLEKDWQVVACFLREHPDFIRSDEELLADVGLRLRADNIVDFGPAALARLHEAKSRERKARALVEATARSNFAAQAQTHAAVIDLLEARNSSDLARRLEEVAQLRFGLVSAVMAIEGPGPVPAGWRALEPGQTDKIIGSERLARMGACKQSDLLFEQLSEAVKSVALVRVAVWSPARQGLVAFGSPDARAFTPDMGAELVAFIARVVERTAERWPAV